jgi:soluble lytic murein transglycosylase-like protein
MIRNHSTVRALCEIMRRPTTRQIAAGLVLMAPAGMLTRRHSDRPLPTTAPIVLTAVEAAVPAGVGETRIAAAATTFAKEYKISPTLAKDIYRAAINHEISPRTAFGLVRAESSFRTSATSPVGAVGLTQLMPATAKWLSPGVTHQQLRNPRVNLNIGFRYLAELKEKYDGDEKLALLAYNRGPGTVDKLLKRGGNPDNGYAEKVWTGRSKKHVQLMNKKFGRRS